MPRRTPAPGFPVEAALVNREIAQRDGQAGEVVGQRIRDGSVRFRHAMSPSSDTAKYSTPNEPTQAPAGPLPPEPRTRYQVTRLTSSRVVWPFAARRTPSAIRVVIPSPTARVRNPSVEPPRTTASRIFGLTSSISAMRVRPL